MIPQLIHRILVGATVGKHKHTRLASKMEPSDRADGGSMVLPGPCEGVRTSTVQPDVLEMTYGGGRNIAPWKG
jgi:hypothetical protein